MLKKMVFFICWLLVLMLALLFCFTFGLWQDWSTPAIMMLWIITLIAISILWQVSPTLTRIYKTKQWRRWIIKLNVSRRDYLLLKQWKQGASIIKRLRRQRKRLPWYLLLGDSCGKSTLLTNADVPRYDDYFEEGIPGPTRTLHWWFFRKLCILELSSNFLKDKQRYRHAWQKLSYWWKSMPAPSGIIVAIPINAIISDDLNSLHALMRQQRLLIEPLIKHFGKYTSLHVLLTQCDKLSAFRCWSEQLSVIQRQEPIGYHWPSPPHIDGQDERMLSPLFASLKRGFSRVRLCMPRPPELTALAYDPLLTFPESIAILEPKLRYAIAALCEPNAYFSHLQLSSIWFSAAIAKNDGNSQRDSYFIHKLLTEYLDKISTNRAIPRWYQSKRGKLWGSIALALCLVWLLTSLGLTISRLHFGLPRQSPNGLANFIARDESFNNTTLGYLPFKGVVIKQYQRAEARLMNSPSKAKSLSATLDSYKQSFYQADLQKQRSMILQLSHAVITWQRMQAGAKLSELSEVTPIDSALTQRTYPKELSALALMALERGYIQQHEGNYWLQQARACLQLLVNHSSNTAWLTAPNNAFLNLSATQFWHFLPTTITLSGLWTEAGQQTISAWIKQIEEALGQPQPLLHKIPMFNKQLRQNAWEKFIIEITTGLNDQPARSLPLAELIAVSQNQSQAMQFLARTQTELQDISFEQAQPWLLKLRDLQNLIALESKSAMVRKIGNKAEQFRKSFLSWLRQVPAVPNMSKLLLDENALRQWLDARGRAVTEAVAQAKADTYLTRGLFETSPATEEKNPLLAMFPALKKLKQSLAIENDNAGVAAVWLLYREDAHSLISHAVAQSACWLNQKWRMAVIWPLNQRGEALDYTDLQMDSKTRVTNFLQNSAKPFLLNSLQGQVAAHYENVTMPLTQPFIRLIRGSFSPDIIQDLPNREVILNKESLGRMQEQRQIIAAKKTELEQKSWTTTIASLPASTSNGAAVLPIGTQLTLHCQTGDQQISSMNLADTRQFIWQPGLCQSLTLNVLFPNFTARYSLEGYGAWPEFLHRLTHGQLSLASSDFNQNSALLQQLGINHILVRFNVINPIDFYPTWLDWRNLDRKLTAIDEQTSLLNSRGESDSLSPISDLPVDIAQCN